MSNLKTYSIPITWMSYNRYSVEAENLQEAVTKVLKQFFSEPDEKYLDDSWELDSIIEEDYPDEKIDYLKLNNDL